MTTTISTEGQGEVAFAAIARLLDAADLDGVQAVADHRDWIWSALNAGAQARSIGAFMLEKYWAGEG